MKLNHRQKQHLTVNGKFHLVSDRLFCPSFFSIDLFPGRQNLDQCGAFNLGSKQYMNIFLLHRDLRIIDNTALNLQLSRYKAVTPIFIFTPQQIKPQHNPYFSHRSVQFMVESLRELEQAVAKQQGMLYYFMGDTMKVLENIRLKAGIRSVYFNADYTPFAKKRDQEIEKWGERHGIDVKYPEDYVLYDILNGQTKSQKSDKPYQVFTPFKRQCLQNLEVRRPNLQEPKKGSFQVNPDLEKLKESLPSGEIGQFYEYSEKAKVKGGRSHALKILSGIKKFKDYNKLRNYPAIGNTCLSAYLHFTTVSIREVYHRVLSELGIGNDIINELHFRDFYVNITHYYPKVLDSKLKNFQEKFDPIKWKENEAHLQAWKEGKTGFPIVDAAMRQLNETGFMHNRCRMIVANFFAKDLFLDWKLGEQYFATKEIDYSAMQNSAGWQWAVGNGTDAQPYFRIFNPWTQQANFDQECKYIKQWVPELAGVPIPAIHKWFVECHLYIGKGVKYPKPIVNHDIARKETLEIYAKYFKSAPK